MQRNEAMKWFWPFLAAAAVAVGLSAYVQAKMIAAPSALPPSSASARESAQVEPKHVAIEPSRIEVIGRRTPVQLGARTDAPARGKHRS